MSRALRILAWPAFKAKLSPYNRLLYTSMQNLGVTVEEFSAWRVVSRRYDIVHFHWPEYCVNGRGPLTALLWSFALFGAICWVRLRGGRVIWTVHNLGSHRQQYPTVEQYFWKIFTALVNGYITLTELGGQQARQCYPALQAIPASVIPHGNLREAYPGGDIQREQARARLGIPSTARVLAFFGAIDRYKGVVELVRAFSTVPDERAVLLVAGKCCLAPQERKEIEDIAASDARVLLRLTYIPENDVACYIRAADLIVLPFRDILNSGSAILALSLDRPVLVPPKGSMQDLQVFAGPDWVRLYSGELTPEILHQQLEEVITSPALRGRCRALENGWAGLRWTHLARLTLEAYRSVLQPAARPAPERRRFLAAIASAFRKHPLPQQPRLTRRGE